MRKIANGKRYDTETATLIGETSNIGRGADSAGDFNYWSAGLYRSPRGAHYFLAGEGGPMSRFGQSVGQNSWGGGRDIIPMSKEEAFEWAQENLTPDEVEAAFGDMVEEA